MHSPFHLWKSHQTKVHCSVKALITLYYNYCLQSISLTGRELQEIFTYLSWISISDIMSGRQRMLSIKLLNERISEETEWVCCSSLCHLWCVALSPLACGSLSLLLCNTIRKSGVVQSLKRHPVCISYKELHRAWLTLLSLPSVKADHLLCVKHWAKKWDIWFLSLWS